MEVFWHDRIFKPKKSGHYLCAVLKTELAGEYSRRMMVIYFNHKDGDWIVTDCIVTNWTELPEFPERMVL